jgi:DNA invertase Pin-like site-specific DNA recombinase
VRLAAACVERNDLLLLRRRIVPLGIQFISYQENIDTSSPLGQALFTIVSAVAQFERELIRERARAGLRNARAKGRTLGRPGINVDASKIVNMRGGGISMREIAATLGCSPAYVHKTLSNLQPIGVANPAE